MNLQKIKRALISVSDKAGIIELARFLEESQIEIISTGGTYKLLKENKISVKDISEFTGFPEIMDGRVKTLHPKVHGGLLAVLDNKTHHQQMQENQIQSIDLVVVNLYPFAQTVRKGAEYEEVIENIDIGGPSMIRSAAKNHHYKTVITNPDDYAGLIAEMNKHNAATSLKYRQNQARKAFITTANYDQAIADYFNKTQKISFPEKLILPASLKQELRYGENAHQKAALYQNDFSGSGIVNATKLQGKELSYNNLNDSDTALNILLEFSEPAVAIIKHANPCGVAIADDIFTAYKKAFAADSKSAFGGIVALNCKIEKDLAELISQIFFEVIIAPDFSEDALRIFSTKKNLRLLKSSFKSENQKMVKSISGGFLVQDGDNKILSAADLKLVSNVKADEKQIAQLLLAMKICKYVKSNAIVVVNDFQTVGVGAGQTSRVDAMKIACEKAINFSDSENKLVNKCRGAVLASDAFFPFADNIEIAAQSGISAIIAPAGSIRDEEVIEAAKRHNIALYFIDTRHFRH